MRVILRLKYQEAIKGYPLKPYNLKMDICNMKIKIYLVAELSKNLIINKKYK